MPTPDDPSAPVDSLADLTALSVRFRDEREWRQFHTPQALAANLVIEAAELLEVLQWRTPDEVREHLDPHAPGGGRQAFEEELCDVLFSVLLLAHDQGVDLPAAFRRKMRKNAEKYPVEKARGRREKYDRL